MYLCGLLFQTIAIIILFLDDAATVVFLAVCAIKQPDLKSDDIKQPPATDVDAM